jgi:WD40 repeat protein
MARLWDWRSGRCRFTIKCATTSISTIWCNKSVVLCGDASGAISLWCLPAADVPKMPLAVSRPRPASELAWIESRFVDLALLADSAFAANRLAEANASIEQARALPNCSDRQEVLVLRTKLSRKARRVGLRSVHLRRTIRDAHPGGVNAVALARDSRSAASVGNDGHAVYWNLLEKSERRITEHRGPVNAVWLDESGHFLVTGGSDGSVRMWKTQDSSCVGTIAQYIDAAVTSLDIDQAGRLVLLGNTYFNVDLVEVGGVVLRVLHRLTSGSPPVRLSRDGMLALVSDGRQAHLIDVATGRCWRTFRHDSSTVRSLTLSLDRQCAVLGGSEGALKIWEVGSSKCLRTLVGHRGTVRSIAISGDNRFGICLATVASRLQRERIRTIATMNTRTGFLPPSRCRSGFRIEAALLTPLA